jgi:tetratricopeptide (TPR) repeat protein
MKALLRVCIACAVFEPSVGHGEVSSPLDAVPHERPVAGQAARDVAAEARYKKIYDKIQTSYYDSEGMSLAAQWIVELQAEFPNSPFTKLAMAEFQFAQVAMSGRKAGLDDVQSLASQANGPASADGFVLRAKVEVEKGNPDWALAYAKKAVELAPEKPEAHYAMGRAEHAKHRPVEAARWFRRAADGMSDPRRKSNLYYWLGNSLVGVDLSPTERKKYLREAWEAYRLHAELDPTPDKLNSYGWFLAHHAGDFAEAEKVLSRTLKDAPDFGYARENLAVVQYQRWAADYLAGKTQRKADALEHKTGLSIDGVFVKTAEYPALTAVPRALLKSNAIGNVDVITDGEAGPGGCRCTALIRAARGGNTELARDLLEAGANINAEDVLRITPLAYAVRRQHVDMTSLLLSRGARPNVFDVFNMTPLERSIGLGEAGLQAFHLLLKHHADPRTPDSNGQPLTFVAANSKNFEALRILIKEHGLDPNATSPRNRLTLLGVAAFAGMEDGVKFLLESGANPWVKHNNEPIVDILDWGPLRKTTAEEDQSLRRIRNIIAEAQKKTPRQ